jgi:hypothetical protein
MLWYSVVSSNLVQVGYDPLSMSMVIRFHGGRVYEYDDVPPEEVEGLINASSVGGYFHRHVKKRYTCRRLR